MKAGVIFEEVYVFCRRTHFLPARVSLKDNVRGSGTMIFGYTLGALIIAITVSEVAPCINSFASVSAVSSSYQNCESYVQHEERRRQCTCQSSGNASMEISCASEDEGTPESWACFSARNSARAACAAEESARSSPSSAISNPENDQRKISNVAELRSKRRSLPSSDFLPSQLII